MAMVTKSEFNAFDENAKAEVTWCGTFLTDRRVGNLKVQLYSLENFYVEVFYDPIGNRIIKIETFQGLTRLSLYF